MWLFCYLCANKKKYRNGALFGWLLFHIPLIVDSELTNPAEVEFPFTHNLTKLANLCASEDASFNRAAPLVEPLTPFAVELRYDAEFWPEKDDALDALRRATSVVLMVRKALGVL